MFEHTKAFSGFSVDDIEKAKQFYGETLGLRVTEDNGMLTMHIEGGTDILAYPKGGDHVPASSRSSTSRSTTSRRRSTSLTERGVTFERYDAMTSDIDDRGIWRGEGPPIAWFKDPAGNILSVLQDG